MFWPARRLEAYNVAAIYRYHPMFAERRVRVLVPAAWATTAGSRPHDFGRSSLEGGDVQPIGNGTVLIGMSERTQARMIEQIAAALFDKGAAERVIAAVMTKDRAHMHLDTVFTMLDRDKVTAYPKVVDGIRAISLRPGSNGQRFHVTEEESFLGAVADAMGVPKLQVVETGGDDYQQEREQWDDGNNVVALEPGVVVAYERNTYTIEKMRAGRRRGDHHRGLRARQGPRRRALHDLPPACATRCEVGRDDRDLPRWVFVGRPRRSASSACSSGRAAPSTTGARDVGGTRALVPEDAVR